MKVSTKLSMYQYLTGNMSVTNYKIIRKVQGCRTSFKTQLGRDLGGAKSLPQETLGVAPENF